MSTSKVKKHLVLQRTERHLAATRLAFALLLFSMALVDSQLTDFAFPPICYILIVGVILGLDASKLIKFFGGKR